MKKGWVKKGCPWGRGRSDRSNEARKIGRSWQPTQIEEICSSFRTYQVNWQTWKIFQTCQSSRPNSQTQTLQNIVCTENIPNYVSPILTNVYSKFYFWYKGANLIWLIFLDLTSKAIGCKILAAVPKLANLHRYAHARLSFHIQGCLPGKYYSSIHYQEIFQVSKHW